VGSTVSEDKINIEQRKTLRIYPGFVPKMFKVKKINENGYKRKKIHFTSWNRFNSDRNL
jgi:hypothetical protein